MGKVYLTYLKKNKVLVWGGFWWVMFRVSRQLVHSVQGEFACAVPIFSGQSNRNEGGP